MAVDLNPEAQGLRRKRFYTVIKNCSECPFWRECTSDCNLQDDFKFPPGCKLQTWRGNEGELHRFFNVQ